MNQTTKRALAWPILLLIDCLLYCFTAQTWRSIRGGAR